MKTISLILLAFLAVCGNGVYAQNLIAVLDNNSNTFYTNLDSAIAHANNGDYIYVPGGFFNLNNPISKEVHIIGTGHYPDSTQATSFTQINSPLYMITGSDNSTIEGLVCAGGLFFGTNQSNQVVNNFLISRSRITNISLAQTSPTTSSNILIKECIFGSIDGGDAQSVLIDRKSTRL